MDDDGEPSPFNAIALPIGLLCITWAHIENTINYYLQHLIPLEIGNVEKCITSNIDFREKIQIVKALGFLRRPNGSWYEELALQLDLLDNDYRPKRNRYIHDLTLLSSNQPTFSRLTGSTKVVKPQAFQKALTMPEFIDVVEDEITSLHKKLTECDDILSKILFRYRKNLP